MQRLALTASENVWRQLLTPKPLSPSTLVRCNNSKTRYELNHFLFHNVNDDVWIFGDRPNVNVFLRWSQFAFVSVDTREAALLFSYAKDLSESGLQDQDETLQDETGEELNASPFFCCEGLLNVLLCLCAVDSITAVFTVSQLKQKAQENLEPFSAITYCFISKLDLDSSLSRVIRSRWWVHRSSVILA